MATLPGEYLVIVKSGPQYRISSIAADGEPLLSCEDLSLSLRKRQQRPQAPVPLDDGPHF